MRTRRQIECERHVITLADGVTMAFRRIPACPEGFLMGSRGYDANEEPIHRVVIPEPFWMAETPVTQAQFAVWTQQAGIEHQNHHGDSGELPAESMTWHQSKEFCTWLTENYNAVLPTDALFATLPCEAHWEYSCRGGTTTEYHTGDGEASLKNPEGFLVNKGMEVNALETTKGPNASNRYGLHGMNGNVWEWCLDRWDPDGYRRRWDGITPGDTLLLAERHGDNSKNPYRLLRGGSDREWWAVNRNQWATGCRSAIRRRDWAGNQLWVRICLRNRNYGFRVCLVRSPFGQTAATEPERTASQRRDGAEMAGSGDAAEILNTDFTD